MPGHAHDAIARGIEALADLPRATLVERWTRAYGRLPPKGTSRRLLERAVAYQIQTKAFGGLKPKVRRELLRIADSRDRGGPAEIGPSRPSRSVLRPGMRLVREWNGRTHTVEVDAKGFVWNSEQYQSLSAVAHAITGARWSGPRFFGL